MADEAKSKLSIGNIAKAGLVGFGCVYAAKSVQDSNWYKTTPANPDGTESTSQMAGRYGAAAAVVVLAHMAGLI